MKKQIKLLCTGADRAQLAPILEQLRAKGLRVAEAADAGKNDLVLAVLSERFYADSEKTDALLGLIGAGAENVLPLQLDGAVMPDALKNALYARNIIPAAGRDAALIAERIVSALPKKKSRLGLILSAAALVLAALIALLIWRGAQNRESVSAMAGTHAVPIPEGITAEELAQIKYAYFVADGFYHYTEEELLEHFQYPATYHMEEDGMHWYSTEDGHRLSLTSYSPESLEFLKLMTNLEGLDLILVDVDRLPDLSGLPSLSWVEMADCTTRDLSGLSGSSLEYFHLFRCPVEDYSVLTNCERLTEVRMEFEFQERADLSAFSPPNLTEATFEHGNGVSVDLSGLALCPKLQTLRIGYLPLLADLSFLSGTPLLTELSLEELPALRDVSPVGTLKALRELEIKYCARVTDYSPIALCTALERIHVQGDLNPDALRDASFLAELPKLRDIGLYSCNLRDMNFLEGVADNDAFLNLGFAGDIQDYSGLSYIKRFGYLHVNPRYWDGSRGGDFSAVLPYIQDAQIDSLMLYTCRGVDLSLLPDGIGELSIRYGDLSDLSGLKPYSLRRLELWDCQYLSSLNGLENLPTLFGTRGQMELSITGCPRLTDYSALQGAYLETLKLTGTYTVPDLHRSIKINNLFLDSIEGLRDLSCLDGLIGGDDCNLSLVGLNELYDLTPLRSLSGEHLTVPPQVAEQAEELVENGNYDDYQIAYPDGSWQPFEGTVELLSLDELDTLPKALLKRVESVALVGDQLVDTSRYDIREDWERRKADGSPSFVLTDRTSGEEIPVGEGGIDSLERLSALTGLKRLLLCAQPLETLDAIQYLSDLESLELRRCPKLEDASAAFACQQLRYLTLENCPLTDIQGVRNLRSLEELSISGTGVVDLTPVLELEELRSLRVSRDMEQAVASLDGQEYRFALEIEGD